MEFLNNLRIKKDKDKFAIIIVITAIIISIYPMLDLAILIQLKDPGKLNSTPFWWYYIFSYGMELIVIDYNLLIFYIITSFIFSLGFPRFFENRDIDEFDGNIRHQKGFRSVFILFLLFIFINFFLPLIVVLVFFTKLLWGYIVTFPFVIVCFIEFNYFSNLFYLNKKWSNKIFVIIKGSFLLVGSLMAVFFFLIVLSVLLMGITSTPCELC